MSVTRVFYRNPPGQPRPLPLRRYPVAVPTCASSTAGLHYTDDIIRYTSHRVVLVWCTRGRARRLLFDPFRASEDVGRDVIYRSTINRPVHVAVIRLCARPMPIWSMGTSVLSVPTRSRVYNVPVRFERRGTVPTLRENRCFDLGGGFFNTHGSYGLVHN